MTGAGTKELTMGKPLKVAEQRRCPVCDQTDTPVYYETVLNAQRLRPNLPRLKKHRDSKQEWCSGSHREVR
jgi:hypothetical protein